MSSEYGPIPSTLTELIAVLVKRTDLAENLVRLVECGVDLLGVTATGLMVVDPQGTLDVAATTSGPARLLLEFEKANFEGPARDSFHGGHRVDCPDLAEAVTRWPRFTPVARRLGVGAIHAFPMTLHDQPVGTMSLFNAEPGAIPSERLDFAQFLANVATLGVGSHRARKTELLAAQLQNALHSRVLIEQAKGLLAERWGVTVDEAFATLRHHARRTGRRLDDVARSLLDGSLDLPAVAE